MTADPKYSFQLPRGLLRAMVLFQAPEDRPQLACTSLEIRRAGEHHEITLVSIDGIRLASYQTEILQDTLWGILPDSEQIVVDLSGCEKLPKQTIDFVTVEVFAKHVEFVAGKIRYSADRRDAVEGGAQYPDWRSLIPSREPERVDQVAVNYERLADFGKAAKLIHNHGGGGGAISLRTFGEGSPVSVQIVGHREFYGIIMPLKSDHPEAFPDWLKTEKERKEDAAKEGKK